LLRQLLNGQPFDNDQLGELAQRAGMDAQHNMSDRRRMERRLRQEAGLSQIQQLIEQLLQELQEMGMDANTLQQLRQKLLANAHGLSEQLSNFAGLTLAENMAQDNPPPSRT
jgi:predicted ribosome quality control (RQC) complex YloA/Tae2 family protein